jgi:hypothetical protein
MVTKKRKKMLSHQVYNSCLQEKFFDLLLDVGDLWFELGALVLRHAGGDDRPGDTAGSAQRLLGPHEHIGHVLHGTERLFSKILLLKKFEQVTNAMKELSNCIFLPEIKPLTHIQMN